MPIITGFSIALSPTVNKGIDKLTRFIKTPKQVYFFVVMIGMLLCLVSFGWIVITCVLARELAKRVKGINYPFLVACVYLSMNSWVLGLSSSIPLLLNTEKNYLIEAGILNNVISTSYTLGSLLNLSMIVFLVVFEVLRQVGDPLCEDRNLNFGGACVAVFGAIFFDERFFALRRDRHRVSPKECSLSAARAGMSSSAVDRRGKMRRRRRRRAYAAER